MYFSLCSQKGSEWGKKKKKNPHRQWITEFFRTDFVPVLNGADIILSLSRKDETLNHRIIEL